MAETTEEKNVPRREVARCRICKLPIFSQDKIIRLEEGMCHDLCYYEEIGDFIQSSLVS